MWIYIVLGVVGALILFYILPTLLISNRIYSVLLVRKNKDKWGRSVSWDNDEQREMFKQGALFEEENKQYDKKISIVSDGFKLIGEYYDFGYNKTVIIIPGRMESGTYSLYFAPPYKKAGYNILAIDNRCHGESEGRYNCIGLKEYKDILAWSRLLHDEYKINNIIIHGICIGSATALYSLIDKECGEYVKGMVADGMYADFGESLKNHLIERKKPIFPYNDEIMMMITLVAKKSPIKYGPIKVIDKLNKPILFLYSKEDIYSTKPQADALFDACKSDKKIVWFDKGVHSHIRINNMDKYDEAIKEFVKDNF